MATAEKKRPRSSSSNGGVGKRLSRKEILGRKKAVKELIRKAVAMKDHLAQFPDFHKYQSNGLLVYLEYGYGNQLPLPTRKYIQNLLKVNMEGQYGPEWPSEEKVKRREMVAPEARYIFVRQSSNAITTQNIMKQDSRLEFTHEAYGVFCPGEGAGKISNGVGRTYSLYVISSTSPSRVDPLIGLEKNYEILCKAFESEAKSILEEGN
uniref:Uncharacterized protein n=2 Tax=Oryza rufipogon TaxID=4529 RepID=A0A0E0PLW7_ORYRU